jgi:hypothetical protein
MTRKYARSSWNPDWRTYVAIAAVNWPKEKKKEYTTRRLPLIRTGATSATEEARVL